MNNLNLLSDESFIIETVPSESPNQIPSIKFNVRFPNRFFASSMVEGPVLEFDQYKFSLAQIELGTIIIKVNINIIFFTYQLFF